MSKITVIGTGSVGSTVAYTLTITGIATEICMIDINSDRAAGEAMDIRQGTPFCNPCSIYAGDYPDAVDSDIVVITSGVARKPGQTRLELAQTNVNILKSITPQITKYAPDATYVIVSNPVDVMTYAFCKFSGLPEERIVGTGTILDTSRLRSRLSEQFSVSQHNVHAYVLGEHGDSSFIPWSVANISNVPLEKFRESIMHSGKNPKDLDREELVEYVRKSGGIVIKQKGATYYAIAMSTCHLCKCLLNRVDTTLTVSTMMHGEYGIEDCCLSVLNIVGKRGVQSKVMLSLTHSEVEELRHSANCLKEVIKSVEI